MVTLHGGDMDWSNEWCQIGPPVGDSRYYMSLLMRKATIWVSDYVRHKQTSGLKF